MLPTQQDDFGLLYCVQLSSEVVSDSEAEESTGRYLGGRRTLNFFAHINNFDPVVWRPNLTCTDSTICRKSFERGLAGRRGLLR